MTAISRLFTGAQKPATTGKLAFSSEYPSTNNDCNTVLYGFASRFVVYLSAQWRGQSGSAGVVVSKSAAAGPAFWAIVVGLTVRFYKENQA